MTDELTEPERVDLETPDLTGALRAAFEQHFPGVLADGVIDAERLRQLLDVEVIGAADNRERFGLMWAGKREALRSLQRPSRGTLVPELNGSSAWDAAQNVFIEGDNLEVLKLLQKAYNDQIKLIFIDPPYNTGNDFVYHDDFRDTLRGYLRFAGELDEAGNRTSADADLTGRRHSRWLSMMHPRLILAKNLLRQDGVIFVAIDDNEGAHLRVLMDEVFGPENFLANVVWKHTQQSKNDEPYFSRHWNALLVYRRSSQLASFTMPRREEHNQAYRNPDNDPRGPWRSGDVRSPSPRPTLRYPISTPSGGVIEPPANGWRWSKDSVAEKIATGEIVFSPDETRIIRKIHLADQGGRTPENVWDGQDVGVTRDANREIREVFGGTIFDTPKPTDLIRRVLELATSADSEEVILDFFAGSGSTAHAVALQNAADGGRRRWINVNIPEPVTEGSEASNAGFATVSDITRARLAWVLAHVEGASSAGLRSFRLAGSRFRNFTSDESRNLFDLRESTLDDGDHVMEDLAQEVLLKEGVRLDAMWDRHQAAGAPVIVADGVAVVMSLDLTQEIADAALALEPKVVVFLEDGFAGADAVKANAFTNAKTAGIVMKTV